MRSKNDWLPRALVVLALPAASCQAVLGIEDWTPMAASSGGSSASPSSGGSAGSVGANGGSGANTAGGDQQGGGGTVNAGGAGNAGGDDNDAGAAGTGGDSGVVATSPNYQLTGSWPELQTEIAQTPGTLGYQRIQVTNAFLAESCTIADYNADGNPDISAGRRWYEGPSFTVEHIFRGGHDVLPALGDTTEITTGISDDFADYPWDVNGDGFVDIINIASPDANSNVNPAPAPQTNATAYWYENPGAGWDANPEWTAHLMHDDVRHEQHGLLDVDGDGKPEIFGACRDCDPVPSKGYYFADWSDPAAPWDYEAVTGTVVFPFSGTGWMHGLGFGDVDGDGQPDLLDRGGAWLQGQGWQHLPFDFYDGHSDDNRGGAHMYAWDIDGDGDQDVFSADWAHGFNLAWYEQTPGGPQPFVRHQFLGTDLETATYGVEGFSQPHAAQVVDMDGDGIRDIVTGKMRLAHPNGYGDPDIDGVPYLYVFRTVRDQAGVSGQAHFEAHLVDNLAGVGRQLAVGHANLDGIPDICVATKLGIYVFLAE